MLSDSPFYGLVLICILVAISSRGEKLLFKISTGMVLTKLLVVAALGVSMVGMWHLYNVGSLPPLGLLVKNAIITLPFTLTSILFIQTLSPMVISYRSREKSIEVARHKALRAMNIAFGILFVTVFFYAVSFTLAMGHDEAVKAYEQNISALAIAAQFISGDGAAWGESGQRHSQYLCCHDCILWRLFRLSRSNARDRNEHPASQDACRED